MIPGEETAVWQALTLLEEGLTHSPSNAQFKLLLVRIYCVLGAFEPVVDLYSSLDAKHIQHDTIGLVVYTLSTEQAAAWSLGRHWVGSIYSENRAGSFVEPRKVTRVDCSSAGLQTLARAQGFVSPTALIIMVSCFPQR